MRTFLRLDAAVLAVAAVALVVAGSTGWAIVAGVLAVDAVALSYVPARWLPRRQALSVR
jgi:hypothetical protein